VAEQEGATEHGDEHQEAQEGERHWVSLDQAHDKGSQRGESMRTPDRSCPVLSAARSLTLTITR
jgi:hypothetical protein